jgi:hypothetical protein
MLIRLARAFAIALRMTLRGQRPTPKYPALEAWMAESSRLIDAAYAAAEADGLGKAGRKALSFRVEGRETQMEAVLGGARFHHAQEYRYLLRNETAQSLLAIQASNVNDVFRLKKLSAELAANREGHTGARNALEALIRHLESMPAVHNTEA